MSSPTDIDVQAIVKLPKFMAPPPDQPWSLSGVYYRDRLALVELRMKALLNSRAEFREARHARAAKDDPVLIAAEKDFSDGYAYLRGEFSDLKDIIYFSEECAKINRGQQPAQLSAHSPIRLPSNLPVFGGDSPNAIAEAEEFLLAFESRLFAHRIPEEEFSRALLGSVLPQDAPWVADNISRRELPWEDACAVFLEHFVQPHMLAARRSEFRAISMKPQEEVCAFCDRFLRLAVLARIDDADLGLIRL